MVTYRFAVGHHELEFPTETYPFRLVDSTKPTLCSLGTNKIATLANSK